MNKTALAISQRLSLRFPQKESLDILSQLTDKLSLKKDFDLAKELEIVKNAYPTCTNFERDFPSICFALATGVGKTRLMGAFISYLFIEKGIRNFFVMAPNLTIYNKLMVDFGVSGFSNAKYVFRGIQEFSQVPPRLINGDNYQYATTATGEESININVFNISKLNAEARGGNEPKIKRLSEYLGESYFEYLSNLPDLVLLMDESHHYRADRGMQVINELKPILGLELTATPQVESGSKTIKFENVVYEYSLSKAIKDGFVKEPAIATRANFDPSKLSPEELDRIKLEDGVRLHEDTKVALDIYSRDSGRKRVKPFVLVVAKDTDHAEQLKSKMESKAFFEGHYAGKVMLIHSNQKGSEKEENVQSLLSLEDPKNEIEIVIHVNMLKEGWDVTNLYTIVPLRTATSMTLREQTIGRGLRLPYGEKTGHKKVDKLTIIAHDKFQALIDEANKPDSIINKENIIEIKDDELPIIQEIIDADNGYKEHLVLEKARIDQMDEGASKQKEQACFEVKQQFEKAVLENKSQVNSIQEFKQPEKKALLVDWMRKNSAPSDRTYSNVTTQDMITQVEGNLEDFLSEFTLRTIEIPRIVIQQSDEVNHGFNTFDLDVSHLNYNPVEEEIVRQSLTQSREEDRIRGEGRFKPDKPVNIIVNELINEPEIDYDTEAELLFKLANQAIQHLQTRYPAEKDIYSIVIPHRRDIARLIFAQMRAHEHLNEPDYLEPKVLPFTEIISHHLSYEKGSLVHHYNDTIEPTKDIPKKVFEGFKRACHTRYKFDSKTEKDFAGILERDPAVEKWMRPAKEQFQIYWDKKSKRYEPDFVVEGQHAIYLIETKKKADIPSEEVQEKAKAALHFCSHATKFNLEHGKKPWKYVIIPHDQVLAQMTFAFLVEKHEYLQK